MTDSTLTALTISRVRAGAYHVTDSRGDKYTVAKAGGAWRVSFRDSTDRVPGIADQPTLREAKVAIAARDARIIADRPEGTPLPPAPVKLTRSERFDDKRARRLEALGATAETITGAKVALVGKSEGSCALCDHGILWLFALHLTLTDGRAVTMDPIGSKCIETWARALAVGPAQEAILESLTGALEDVAALKARMRTIRNGVESGQFSQVQADHLTAFYAAPASVHGDDFLADVARKVLRYGFTDRQWETWSRSVRGALGRAGCPVPSAVDSETEEGKLIARARKVIADGRAGRLERGGALVDMTEKLERYGSFASDKQERFFKWVLRDAEKLSVEEAPPAPEAPAEGGFFGQDMFAGAAAVAPEQSATPHAEDDYDDLPF